MPRLIIHYRRNLKMSPGKLAAQAVHAAIGSGFKGDGPVIVLSTSDAKFYRLRPIAAHVVRDRGLTEVAPGTETVLAFLEP